MFVGLMGRRSIAGMASDEHCFCLMCWSFIKPKHPKQLKVFPKTWTSQSAGPVTKTLSETSTSMDKPVVLNKESGMTFTVLIQCVSVCPAAVCESTSSLSDTSDLQEEWDKLQYYRWWRRDHSVNAVFNPVLLHQSIIIGWNVNKETPLHVCSYQKWSNKMYLSQWHVFASFSNAYRSFNTREHQAIPEENKSVFNRLNILTLFARPQIFYYILPNKDFLL